MKLSLALPLAAVLLALVACSPATPEPAPAVDLSIPTLSPEHPATPALAEDYRAYFDVVAPNIDTTDLELEDLNKLYHLTKAATAAVVEHQENSK